MSHTSHRKLRLLYLAGPGDVIGTYHHWRQGRDDPSQVAWTYSGQFFDVVQELGAEALVVTRHGERKRLVDGPFRIEHRPPLSRRLKGVSYHLAEIGRSLRLSVKAFLFRADVVVIADGNHWFSWTPLAWLGVKLVTSLHCALWPAGHRPQGRIARFMHHLNGRFWRRWVVATICVSPECEKQVREIAGSISSPFWQARAQYDRETFKSIQPPPAERKPFRVMYAGRIEPEKGVFVLLDAAEILERRMPNGFQWEFCGSGSALTQLRQEVSQRGLADRVHVCGPLEREEMAKAYQRSHAVVVPTTTRFAEGLNKVAVEAILAGRPVVTTRLAHAEGVLDEVMLLAEPDDANSFAEQIERLANDPARYDEIRARMPEVAEQFYDRSQSWKSALKASVQHALKSS